MSSRPYRSTVSATAFSTCVRLVTSTFAANASIPSSTSPRAVAAAPSVFTSVRQTRAPSRANRRATASPIPRPAPVTMATLPSSLPIGLPSVGAISLQLSAVSFLLIADSRMLIAVKPLAGLLAQLAGPYQISQDLWRLVVGVAGLFVDAGGDVEGHVEAYEVAELEGAYGEAQALFYYAVYVLFGGGLAVEEAAGFEEHGDEEAVGDEAGDVAVHDYGFFA